jgi:hypothetical protein
MFSSDSDTDEKNLKKQLKNYYLKKRKKEENRKYYLNKIKNKKLNTEISTKHQTDIELDVFNENFKLCEAPSNLDTASDFRPDSSFSYHEDEIEYTNNHTNNPTDCSSQSFSSDENSHSLIENDFNENKKTLFKECSTSINEFAISLLILKYKHKLSESAVDDILN